jgi:hypothetical protein
VKEKLQKKKGVFMKTSNKTKEDSLLPEYDFTSGMRGKYYKRYHQKSNIVVLEPDIAEAFPNAEAVNQALRSIRQVAVCNDPISLDTFIA